MINIFDVPFKNIETEVITRLIIFTIVLSDICVPHWKGKRCRDGSR